VIVCRTLFVLVAMRESVPSKPFATQTEFPPTAMPDGPPPTSIVWLTLFVFESIRETEFSSPFATQIAPSPAATALGACPTGIWAEILPLLALISPTSFGATVPEALALPRVNTTARTAANKTAATPAAPPTTRRSRRHGLRMSSTVSCAASTSWPSRPSASAGAVVFSAGNSSWSPGAVSW
jgi:hypothetical protein